MAQTLGRSRRHVIVEAMKSLYDLHFRFVFNEVVGSNRVGEKILKFYKTHGKTRLGCAKVKSLSLFWSTSVKSISECSYRSTIPINFPFPSSRFFP